MQRIENKYSAILFGLLAEHCQDRCTLLLLCAKLGHFDVGSSTLPSLSLFLVRKSWEGSVQRFQRKVKPQLAIQSLGLIDIANQQIACVVRTLRGSQRF